MRLVNAFLIAFSTYSRVPVPKADWSDENMRYSMCFFPLIGLIIGAVTLGWLYLADALRFGGLLKGAVCAALPLILTGGIHMDGFLDTTDALASWQPKDKRLEILKDTHVGAFAVIACCVYMLVFAGIYSEATPSDAAVLAPGFILSRALSALAVALFPSARDNGMLNTFAKSADKRRIAYCSIGYIALTGAIILALDWRRGCAGLVACAAGYAFYRWQSGKYFGGVTGDLAGHFLQKCELAYACAVILVGRLL